MHTDGNLQSSISAATTLIKGAIQQRGKRQDKITADIDVHTQFQIIHDLLDSAPEQFIIWMYEKKQSMLRLPRHTSAGLRYEYTLRNYAGGQGNFSIDELCDKLPDAGLLEMDLRNEVSLSDRGGQYAQWLIENGHKATYFRSIVGQWGDTPEGGGYRWPGEGISI